MNTRATQLILIAGLAAYSLVYAETAHAGFLTPDAPLAQSLSSVSEAVASSSVTADAKTPVPSERRELLTPAENGFGNQPAGQGMGTQVQTGPTSGSSPVALIELSETNAFSVVTRLTAEDNSPTPSFHTSRLFRPPRSFM